jgi:hypothetical protein
MRAREIIRSTRVDEGVADDLGIPQSWQTGGEKAANFAKKVGRGLTQGYLGRAGAFGAQSQAQARAAKGTQIVSSIQSNQFITNMKERLDNGTKDGYIAPEQVGQAVKQLLEPRIAKFVNREENQQNIDKFADAIQKNYASGNDPSATIGKLYNYLVYWAQQSISPEQVAQASQRSAPTHDTQKAKEISKLVRIIDANESALTSPAGQEFIRAANALMDELNIPHTQ